MKRRDLKLLVLSAAFIFFVQFIVMISPALAQTETMPLKNGNITLNAPYDIEQTMMYKDGGTIAIVIKDANGISLPLCYDQRIKIPEADRFVYVGATYPDESSAVKVERGSTTEQALLRVLTTAKITNPSPHIRKDLVQTVVEKLKGPTRLYLR